MHQVELFKDFKGSENDENDGTVAGCCRIHKFHLYCIRVLAISCYFLEPFVVRIMIESSSNYPEDCQRSGKLGDKLQITLARRT